MAKDKPKKPMTMEQARKMVAGQFKSPSAIGKALRELMAGGPGVEQTTIPEAGREEPWPYDNPDTTEERKALGIPPRPDPENEDTEGW